MACHSTGRVPDGLCLRPPEPSVRLAVYRKNKDASQGVKLYNELVVAECKRRTWGDVVELLKV